MISLTANLRLQAALSRLADAPDEWDRAMANPRGLLSNQGIPVPDDLTVEFVNELSTPRGDIGKPSPDRVYRF
jgi:hypothetical protein